jgi:ATP-dependent exoDNAse (exonuclease V) beta subunit
MRIDLLYRQGDRWHIVDFKSDDITDELTLRDRIARYRPQLVRYAAAVRAILGVSPTASLCLLNDRGAVHVVPIPLGGVAQGAPPCR